MKALELIVYPKSRGMFGAQYDMPGGVHMLAREGADVMSRNKRLTDAELAAEFHAQQVRVQIIEDGSPHNSAGPTAYLKLKALHRFATLPHYDEPKP